MARGKSEEEYTGMLTLLTVIILIPILTGAMWVTITTNHMAYARVMTWLLLATAVSLTVVTLLGFACVCLGAHSLVRCCERIIKLLIILLTVFLFYCFIIPNASTRHVKGRAYKEYYFKGHSKWASNSSLERVIYSTIRESNACAKMGRVVDGVPESADMFYHRKLNPIQSGCCKPPSECGYVYVNETFWNPGGGGMAGSSLDCVKWTNDQEKLCYACDSCKAAVLAIVGKRWRTLGYILLVTLFFWFSIAKIIPSARDMKTDERADSWLDRLGSVFGS